MWTYEGYSPGPTIEARRGERFQLAWRNQLTGTIPVRGVFVEPEGPPPGFQALNTPGSQGAKQRDEVAALTAWTSAHLHGGRQHGISDGAPDSGVPRAARSSPSTRTTSPWRTSSTTTTPCR